MLSIRELAASFQLPVDTINKWIKEGRINAHRMGDNIYVDQNELRRVLEQSSKIPSEGVHNVIKNQEFSLVSSLKSGGVFHGVSGSTRDEVLMNSLENIRGIREESRHQLHGLLIEREELSSTGVGDGIAFPHARGSLDNIITEPILSLNFLENPVEFGAVDGQAVHILFLLFSPDTKTHLKMLSALSFALSRAEIRSAVMNHEGESVILSAFSTLEQELKTKRKGA
ncbi:PTS sugar transporter subunit IIA [Myxococcota bacterium]|nr:PTS sugar transporter subunit IIA [Myxococcota bacterium]MBU1379233.1 PTS sugar transporter subunit IIA [Myxococcota bacterium]MBU1497115.1 PTS sugar transporter subunit IIA [Myxococcota bacterium]